MTKTVAVLILLASLLALPTTARAIRYEVDLTDGAQRLSGFIDAFPAGGRLRNSEFGSFLFMVESAANLPAGPVFLGGNANNIDCPIVFGCGMSGNEIGLWADGNITMEVTFSSGLNTMIFNAFRNGPGRLDDTYDVRFEVKRSLLDLDPIRFSLDPQDVPVFNALCFPFGRNIELNIPRDLCRGPNPPDAATLLSLAPPSAPDGPEVPVAEPSALLLLGPGTGVLIVAQRVLSRSRRR